jgi:hypothetical protein
MEKKVKFSRTQDVVAITPGKPIEYVLPMQLELPPEKQTVFLLGALDYKSRATLMQYTTEMAGIEKAYEESKLAGAEQMKIIMSAGFMEAALGTLGHPKGLIGWKNFKDQNGDEVEFNPDDFLNRLMPDYLLYLTMAVYQSQFLTKVQRKK